MKTLITGAAGFVGSTLADFLITREHKVDLIDNYYLPSTLTQIKGVPIVKDDIRKLSDLNKYDVLVHLAAISGIRACEDKPKEAFDVNVRGTFNLLRTFKGRAIFASTSAVYGEARVREVTEELSPKPRNYYGTTKLKGEELISLLPNFCILRFSNIYGKGYFCKRTVADLFIEGALKSEPLLIHGDGKQRRDFVHINDAIKGYWYAINSTLNDTFNIGGDETLSINDIAELVKENHREIFGVQPEIKRVPIEGGNVWRDFTYSSEKAKVALNYRPSYSIRDEIRNRLNAHKRKVAKC